MPHSHGLRCINLAHDFDRPHIEIDSFTGAHIHSKAYCIQLLLAVYRQSHSPWQVTWRIRPLMFSLLPRWPGLARSSAEVNSDPRLLGDFSMSRQSPGPASVGHALCASPAAMLLSAALKPSIAQSPLLRSSSSSQVPLVRSTNGLPT